METTIVECDQCRQTPCEKHRPATERILYSIECRLAAKAQVTELNNDEQCILFDVRMALNDVSFIGSAEPMKGSE